MQQGKERRQKSPKRNTGKRKRYSKRKIKLEDILMGKGMEVFSLKQELVSSGPRITWLQLPQLSPSVWKEWGRLMSIFHSERTHM